MGPAKGERAGGSGVDDRELLDRPVGITVAEDDLPCRSGRRFVPRVIGPPLLQVVGAADDLEDDLWRCADEDLALDGSELHVILLQRLVAYHANPQSWI